MENWKDVAGWEGLYQVSDLGRIKSLPRTFVTKNRWGAMMKTTSEKISAPNLNKGNHYLAVTLTRGGVPKRRLIHSLVCEAFHGPRPSPRHHCAHGDGNPINNRADNLRWATVKENSADTRKHGRLRVGEKSNLSRLTEQDVIAIRKRFEAGSALSELAEEYRMTKEGVSKIVKRQNWAHLP